MIVKQGVSVTNFRRNTVLTAIFAFAAAAAIIVTVIAGRLYDQNGLLFGGKTSTLAAGWLTPDGTRIDLPGTLATDVGGSVSISNELPPELQEGTVLFLRSTYLSLDVRIDGRTIYSWQPENRAMFRTPFGLSAYIVDIPSSAAGKTIELTMRTSQQAGKVSVYSATLGDGIAMSVTFISRSVDTLVLLFVLAVMFVLVSVSALILNKRIRGPKPLDAFYLALFILLSAVWLMTDSTWMLLFTRNAAATLYCSLFSLMLMPVPLLMFLHRHTYKGKHLLNSLTVLFLANFVVCFVLHVTGMADLIQTLFMTHLLELLACISVLIVFTIELIRYKRRDMVEILTGLGLLCLLSIASLVVRIVGGDPESTVLFHVGLALFVLALGAGVIRRGISGIARSKSYEKLALSIPCGICRIESFSSGRIVFANEFYYRLFGYTEDEARRAGFTSAEFTVHPDDLEAMKDKIRKHAAEKALRFETEERHVKKDGEVIWILARCKIDSSEKGEITIVMIDITDRKRAEEKLRISEEEYRVATRHSNKLILRLDVKTRTTHRQSDIPSVLGVPNIVENVPESIIEAGKVAPDSVEALRKFYDAIYHGEREGSAVVSLFDVNADEYRWFHFDFSTIFDDSGKPAQAIISFYDVTLQRQKELAFQRWQQSFNAKPKSQKSFYEYNLTTDVLEHEEGGMLPNLPDDVPKRLYDLAAYFAKHHIFRDDITAWLEFMNRDRLLERYGVGLHNDKTEFRRTAGDTPMWTALSLQLIPDPYSSDIKGYFLLEDIDEQKKAEIYLQERSTLDALTGLLNRITFIEKFNKILSSSTPETQHALIMLDIDYFKTINDTLGHNVGDELLISIAAKLKVALRSDDLCGRLGGDEFVICLKNMNLGKPLETRVSDLCSLLCDDETWGVAISASFGIAGYPDDGQTFDELYQKADIALYKAKARGRGGFAVYDPQLTFDDLSTPLRHS